MNHTELDDDVYAIAQALYNRYMHKSCVRGGETSDGCKIFKGGDITVLFYNSEWQSGRVIPRNKCIKTHRDVVNSQYIPPLVHYVIGGEVWQKYLEGDRVNYLYK